MMGFQVYITKDKKQMSQVAAQIVLGQILSFIPSEEKEKMVLGLATGSTPTGLYDIIASNQHLFDAQRIVSFNLDEYVGLPGATPEERARHPESYAHFMSEQLFQKLTPSFAKTFIPQGTKVAEERLIQELGSHKDDPSYYELKGTDFGKAVSIPDTTLSDYLSWIKREILDGYEELIRSYGGIDLQVVGVGEKGHIGFHECGIPLEERMLLVKLDESTIQNAVKDGHFSSVEESPHYAISMGAGLVYEASLILLLASGERKRETIAGSLLGPVTCNLPISFSQEYAKKGKMIYIVDELAAKDILGKESILSSKEIYVSDLR
ncbi:putative glucosamine-6-phosphate deaminase 2 [subsurface metagenome]